MTMKLNCHDGSSYCLIKVLYDYDYSFSDSSVVPAFFTSEFYQKFKDFVIMCGYDSN